MLIMGRRGESSTSWGRGIRKAELEEFVLILRRKIRLF